MSWREYNYFVYIMASISGVLYIGVTNNLIRRVLEHKQEINEGFSKRYKTKKLVYYEYFTNILEAIKREKQLKDWRREKKVKLVENLNPFWRNLYEEIKK